MASRRALERVILIILIAGAVLFALLLAGAGSNFITKAKAYHPPSFGGPASSSPAPENMASGDR